MDAQPEAHAASRDGKLIRLILTVVNEINRGELALPDDSRGKILTARGLRKAIVGMEFSAGDRFRQKFPAD
jgi:hypothetical protein